jgi:cytochrome P450
MTQQSPIPYPLTPASTIYHPSPDYAELRERCPVPLIELPDGTPAYLATRHADVRQVFTDQRFSRAAAAGPNRPTRELGSLAEDSLIGMDPPRHTMIRRVVSHAFTPRRVEELRPKVAELVGQIIDQMEAAGPPADLNRYLSEPLPIYVISKLFGIAEADQDKARQWSDALVSDWDADPAAPQAALDAFGEMIADRRRHPGDDLVSALISAWDEQDDLTERELISVTAGIFGGGHETTTNQINLCLLVLTRYPQQLAGLDGHDPDAVARAVEELSRFIQLGENGVLLPRVTTEEVELGGVLLPAGSAVLPAVVSANRDPAVFADADRLDLARANNPHLGFGAGPHHCLGAALARMELQETLGALLRRLPGLRLDVPESRLRFKPGLVVRSLVSLPVTWAQQAR